MIVRPSGTEPKLKCYLEVVVPVHPDDGVDAARIAAAGRLDAIKGDVKRRPGAVAPGREPSGPSRTSVTSPRTCP